MFEKVLNTVTTIVLVIAMGYLTLHIIAAARVDFWLVFGLAIVITFGVPAFFCIVRRLMH